MVPKPVPVGKESCTEAEPKIGPWRYGRAPLGRAQSVRPPACSRHSLNGLYSDHTKPQTHTPFHEENRYVNRLERPWRSLSVQSAPDNCPLNVHLSQEGLRLSADLSEKP